MVRASAAHPPTWCEEVTFQTRTRPSWPPVTSLQGGRVSSSLQMASAVTDSWCALGMTNLSLPLSG